MGNLCRMNKPKKKQKAATAPETLQDEPIAESPPEAAADAAAAPGANLEAPAVVSAAAPGPRVRNIGIVRVKVAEIVENEANWRRHGDDQREAFAGTVAELGWYGYPDVYRTADGQIKLVDGELRKTHLLAEYGPDAEIDVNMVDLSEDEARLALATKDRIAMMADSDEKAIQALLESLSVEDERLAKALADFSAEAQDALEPEPLPPEAGGGSGAPDDFKEFGDDIETDYRCPRCEFAWSGNPKPEQ